MRRSMTRVYLLDTDGLLGMVGVRLLSNQSTPRQRSFIPHRYDKLLIGSAVYRFT